MFENIKWLFFDVGSTLIDESLAYEHRLREIAELSGKEYSSVYKTAIGLYKQNKKGDLETARLLGIKLTEWHEEDERLYGDAAVTLGKLSTVYNIGIIANQSPGTKKRLEKHGILQFINTVVASAEEGVSKPDKRIFKIALERSNCPPENAVMIGDRIDNDIVPAKILGMHTIWIKQGFGRYWNISSEDEMPDAIVDSLTELCNIL
nr:HAD family hydrolase [Clostridia bacterium]